MANYVVSFKTIWKQRVRLFLDVSIKVVQDESVTIPIEKSILQPDLVQTSFVNINHIQRTSPPLSVVYFSVEMAVVLFWRATPLSVAMVITQPHTLVKNKPPRLYNLTPESSIFTWKNHIRYGKVKFSATRPITLLCDTPSKMNNVTVTQSINY